MQIGVVGLGIMGSGITQVVAKAGFQVTVLEVSKEACTKGVGRIRSFMQRGVELGKNTPNDIEFVLSQIQTTTDYGDLSQCGLIIEAVTENISMKHEVFSRLNTVASQDALLATNTSGISVHEIGKVLAQPERLLGLHFFNPVPLMKLVEVVCPRGLPDGALARVKQFCLDIGKEPVVVKDRPGFLVNRLLIPYLNQVANAFDDGLATREDIDVAIELGLGYPMGPLKLMDQIGLDVHLAATTTIYEQTFWPEFRPPAILKEYVDQGWLGRKSGKGFYEFREEKRHE